MSTLEQGNTKEYYKRNNDGIKQKRSITSTTPVEDSPVRYLQQWGVYGLDVDVMLYFLLHLYFNEILPSSTNIQCYNSCKKHKLA